MTFQQNMITVEQIIEATKNIKTKEELIIDGLRELCKSYKGIIDRLANHGLPTMLSVPGPEEDLFRKWCGEIIIIRVNDAVDHHNIHFFWGNINATYIVL